MVIEEALLILNIHTDFPTFEEIQKAYKLLSEKYKNANNGLAPPHRLRHIEEAYEVIINKLYPSEIINQKNIVIKKNDGSNITSNDALSNVDKQFQSYLENLIQNFNRTIFSHVSSDYLNQLVTNFSKNTYGISNNGAKTNTLILLLPKFISIAVRIYDEYIDRNNSLLLLNTLLKALPDNHSVESIKSNIRSIEKRYEIEKTSFSLRNRTTSEKYNILVDEKFIHFGKNIFPRWYFEFSKRDCFSVGKDLSSLASYLSVSKERKRSTALSFLTKIMNEDFIKDMTSNFSDNQKQILIEKLWKFSLANKLNIKDIKNISDILLPITKDNLLLKSKIQMLKSPSVKQLIEYYFQRIMSN